MPYRPLAITLNLTHDFSCKFCKLGRSKDMKTPPIVTIADMKGHPWIVFIAVLCFLLPVEPQAARAETGDPTHGTVNVILATKDYLVAVTDSMLTSRLQHTPTGLKLYAIDDHTICAIAGFYSEEGPDSLQDFAVFVPKIMQDFIEDERHKSILRIGFSDRAADLQNAVSFELTTHIQARSTSEPNLDADDPNFVLELTMAGYDLDGSLKIAEITLRPTRTPRGIEFQAAERNRAFHAVPSCEIAVGLEQLPPLSPLGGPVGPAIRTIKDTLFCEVVGLPYVAEELLAHPAAHTGSSALEVYAKAQTEGTAMSVGDLRALALYLVEQTEDNEQRTRRFRVGGPPQVAVLSGGRLLESPPAIPDIAAGSALRSNSYSLGKFTCTPGRIFIASAKTPLAGASPWIFDAQGNVDVRVDLTNCTQPIDGIIFHDSSFSDSVLTYSGTGQILFGQNNSIVRTSLEIGPKVDIKKVDVRRLICSFPWKAVNQNQKEVKLPCNEAPKR